MQLALATATLANDGVMGRQQAHRNGNDNGAATHRGVACEFTLRLCEISQIPFGGPARNDDHESGERRLEQHKVGRRRRCQGERGELGHTPQQHRFGEAKSQKVQASMDAGEHVLGRRDADWTR